MFNFEWGIVYVLANLMLFMLCYRLFGKKGLYAWIGIATVLANIQVTKTIEVFGIAMTLGNTMYVSLYMTSDLLNEKYGREEARRAVWFGFFTLLMTTVLMQMALVFKPLGGPGDEIQGAMQQIFGLLPRLALGSLTAYFVSQFLDVRLYSWIRRFYGERKQFWIRNNGSTMISSLVDTLIFCVIAFAGREGFTWEVWMEVFWTTYLIKFVLTAVGTPFLYIMRDFKFKQE